MVTQKETDSTALPTPVQPHQIPGIRAAGLAAFLASMLLCTTAATSQPQRVNLQRSFPAVQIGNQLWVGTPHGLYQYDRTDDSFRRFALPGRRPVPEVRQLYYYKEWLWCVLDTGLAALQVRLNDWLVFDATSGLPSDVVTGVSGQGDYVWVSTGNGLARFDLLIEQWETIDARRGLRDPDVRDVLAAADVVWLIAGDAFSEYNPQFEKWRHFTPDPAADARPTRLFPLGDEIWIATENGLIRFSPRLQKQQAFMLPYLNARSLLDLSLEEDRIWALTTHGLYSYEQRSGVWREFEGNSSLEGSRILGGHVNTQQIWVLTERATLVWSRTQRTWEIFDYSSGLSSSGFESAFSDGELTFLFTRAGLEYRRTSRDPWRQYTFERAGGEATGRHVLNDLLDNPEGGRIGLGEYTWLWQGTRITLLQNLQRTISSGEGSSGWERLSGSRLDVKSQLDLSAGRRFTGFYNNVDYTERKYGLRYRGNDSDLVREFTWGDFRREAGQMPFGQNAELYGSTVWLQHGDRTERFKRSLVTARGTAAEIRSRRTYEHFQGATDRFQGLRRDRDYLRNIFAIPGLPPDTNPDELQVFVDDKTALNNTPRTLVRATIAGLTGDFDELRPTDDYYLYARAACVRFAKQAILPQWLLVVRYRLGGQTFERVLQDNAGTTSVRENIYHIGAQRVLPFSFRADIRDTAGVTVPLSRFGMDSDGDGAVDSRWIDYDMGLLLFPEIRPFPQEVYDPLSHFSLYSLQFSGQTELSILQLRHANLVRGSETLLLDGTPAAAGNDFVLDYTNGTLIFVREGLVSPDTRIEIEYEYYEAAGDQLAAAGVQVAPSDHFMVLADWQKTSVDSTHLLTLQGELREEVGPFDLRIVPGLAYQTREKAVTGKSIEGLLSASWIRLQTKVEHYAHEYRNLYHPRSIVGAVNSNMQFSGTLDVGSDVRITGDWKKMTGFPTDSTGAHTGSPSDRSLGASILFHRPEYPGLQVSYFDGRTQRADSNGTKRFVQDLLEYQLPQRWVQALSFKGIRIEQFLRYGTQSTGASSGRTKEEFLQTYARLNALVTEQVQTGFFYRRSNVHDVTTPGRRSPVSIAERLLADVAIGEWRVAQLNARLENTLQQYAHRSGPVANYILRQLVQTNVRLSPGEVWDELSSLYFEVSHAQSVDQAGTREGLSSGDLWRIGAPGCANVSSFVLSRTSSVKNEFRPGSTWFLQSLLEWSNQELGTGGSRREIHSWRLNEKLDIKLGYETRLIAYYRHSFQDQDFGRTQTGMEPSLWLEQRWSENVITTSQVLYRHTKYVQPGVRGTGHDWETTADLTWRIHEFMGIRYGEFRQSLSGLLRKVYVDPRQKNYQLSSSTSVDLYPVHSLIVRLRFDVGRSVDLLFPGNDYTSLAANLRLTLQL